MFVGEGRPKPPTAVAPPLARLVTDLSPLPAMVLNHRYDILAWNPEMARLLIDFAYLRAAWAAYPEDPVLNDLISQCITHNEQFARLWAQRDVKINGRGHKVYGIPTSARSPWTSKSSCHSKTPTSAW